MNSVKTSGDHYFTGKRGKQIGPWSRIKAALDKHMQPDAPFVIHDLRRTFSTGMNALGIAPATVEACLNHVSGTRGGDLPEKTVALRRWADHISALIEGRAAKVVLMKRKTG